MKRLEIELIQSGNNNLDMAIASGCMACLSAMSKYINKYSPNGEPLDGDELMRAIFFAGDEVGLKSETDNLVNEINSIRL